MENDNLEYLQRSVKFAGFGDHFDKDIEKNLKAGLGKFELSTTAVFGKSNVDYKLEFNKSQSNDRYYFNRFTATLPNEDPAKAKSQTFYMNSVTPKESDSEDVKKMKRKVSGVTVKEAYNLLQGRSVYKTLANKDQEPYNTWMKLDFGKQDQHGNNEIRKFTDRYGFDLSKALDKYPIKGLDDPERREQMMQSLQKGNRLQVTFEKEGKEERMLVEANPEFKNLEVYDMNGARHRMNQPSTRFVASESNTFAKSESNEKSKEVNNGESQGKNKAKDDDAEKKTSQRRGMRV